jgi:hypothetical protein
MRKRYEWVAAMVVACIGVVPACDVPEERDTENVAVDEDEGPGEAEAETPAAGELAHAEAPPSKAVPIPPYWTQLALSSPSAGVRVYKKDGEYVTILDMRKGTMKLLTGAVTTPPNSPNYKLVYKKKYTDFWADAAALNTTSSKVKVVFGGTYGAFDQPTGIAFGLKKAGSLVSLGYAAPGGPQPEYPGQVKLITFNNAARRAWIGPYNSDSFSISPDIMGALDVAADKGPNTNKGRTFVGVRDDDGDGSAETVLVFTSAASTQSHAAFVLSSFGAQQQAMIDGSGSTFLIVDGATKIPTDGRLIPQATAFYATQ